MVRTQAAATGLQISSTSYQRLSGGRTNQFFQEQALSYNSRAAGKS